MSIVITGSRGFIGSHLHKLLPAALEFDIKISPFQDVTSANAVERFFQEKRPGLVVHLAANPSPAMAVWSPLQDAKLNVIGTVNVLNASLRYGVDHFIYASTAHVYGSSSQLPTKETHKCDPMGLYALSKYEGELYCRHFHEREGLALTILRLFNVYGPGQTEGFVVPDLLREVYECSDGSVAKARGPPDDSRDFVFVEDVVRAMKRVIEKRPVGEVINIGSGVETTIEQLFHIIAEILGKDIEFLFADRLTGRTPGRFQADITKARSLLAWEPKINIRKGIEMTARSMGFL